MKKEFTSVFINLMTESSFIPWYIVYREIFAFVFNFTFSSVGNLILSVFITYLIRILQRNLLKYIIEFGEFKTGHYV